MPWSAGLLLMGLIFGYVPIIIGLLILMLFAHNSVNADWFPVAGYALGMATLFLVGLGMDIRTRYQHKKRD